MAKIKVLVAGAKGKMGQEVVRLVESSQDLELVGSIDHLTATDAENKEFSNLADAIKMTAADVLVDFTTPASVKTNMELAIRSGISPVVGTTGLTPAELADLDQLAQTAGIGGLVAPNFAIGAVLMMRFAEQAAKYLPNVEIIELHHDQKLDAPSGTAIKTAELIAKGREHTQQGAAGEVETISGARGGEYTGFRIHSIRLPGLVAHQEVIFGAIGQTLTIRHDSINRESFMPGVYLAITRVQDLKGIVYGLEQIMD